MAISRISELQWDYFTAARNDSIFIMYLFFDTETTGLPKNYKAPVTDLENWPRLVQIAWLLYDNFGKEIVGRDYIIKPEGFLIPKQSSDVHGITTERAHEEGIDLQRALEEFASIMGKSKSLVAHNISFDEKIVGAEFLRKKIKSDIFDIDKICTMHSSTDFCQLPGRFGYKWPNLTELHNILFGEGFDGAHDALVDVRACARCFFELKNKKVI